MPDNQGTKSVPVLIGVTLAVGIGSGILGMALAMLLHWIQHIAYGYSLKHIISDESFLEGVSAASGQRRVWVMVLCGVIAGTGWAFLYRYGKPLVSIAESIKSNQKMPVASSIFHALLQIVTIALGSPLGREVAPREMGAVFATWVSTQCGLSSEQSKVMLACGAGAGLAAVYNVPLGGAVFVLEVLLCSFRWQYIIPALATSVIAVLVSWIGLGNEPLYEIPELSLSGSLVVWSVFVGPIIGVAAFWFTRLTAKARAHAQHDFKMVLLCLVNFSIVGVLAIYFPSILGNGKSPAQLEFNTLVGIGLSTILLFIRVIIVCTSLRSGAQGGLLTPSLANGALLAVILGSLWSYLWPIPSVNAYAIVGAAAFLAAAQKMPITAIILIFELTRINSSLLVPVILAVSGSAGMFYYLQDKP